MPEKKKLLILDFNGTLEGRDGLYEGVPEVLKHMHESGDYAMVILSMGSRRSIENLLEEESDALCARGKVDMRRYFNGIYGADEIAQANNGLPDKANPRVLKQIEQDLSYEGVEIDQAESIVVGDSYAEHLLAKRSGIGFIYAGWHDVANGEPVKSGLYEIPPSPDTGHEAITRQDISEAKAVEDVKNLPATIRDLHQEKSAPFMGREPPER